MGPGNEAREEPRNEPESMYAGWNLGMRLGLPSFSVAVH